MAKELILEIHQKPACSNFC